MSLIISTARAAGASPAALPTGAPTGNHRIDAPAPSGGALRPVSQPVVDPVRLGWTERERVGVTNLYSQEMLLRCVRDGDADGLMLDLSTAPVLLDGTAVNPGEITGTVWTAPWPLAGTQTTWDACQFRSGIAIREGRAGISIARLANDDDLGWADRGHIVVRLQLSLTRDGADRDLGTYEFLAGFLRAEGVYRRALTVTEGPFIANVRSDAPDRVVVAFRTEPAAAGRVWVREAPPPPPTSGDLRSRNRKKGEARWDQWKVDRGGSGRDPRKDSSGRDPGTPADRIPRVFDSPTASRHEVEAWGLRPDTEYLYCVAVGGWTSTEYRFRTAPRPGEGTTRFAYAGDSRMGPGGGLRGFMGVNALVFPQELNAAAQLGARFWLHGGDLVSGYTTVAEDFRTQLRAYKWTATPFLRSVPIYAAIGNHDVLVRNFAGPDKQWIGLDRWPYGSDNTEAIIAEELVQPENGPTPSDPRRPSYRRTVYSFSYGPTRIIVLNNCYWRSDDPARFGGAPEGFLFPDQMDWLGAELDRADADPSVRHVFLCLHEPPFPNSAHLGDAMWYHGDVQERAHTLRPEADEGASGGCAQLPGEGGRASGGEALQPEEMGVVEVRNELVRRAASRKTVAILASDEHNYSRMLLTPQTPAGDPAADDPDGDGTLNIDRLSPVPGLKRPIWFVISGGAGAPHYAEEASPWNSWWKAGGERCREAAGCYRFSPLNHWVMFEDDGREVSLRCYTPAGDLIDEVDDLVEALRR